MRRLALLIASSLVLTGCGGTSERLASFTCDQIPEEGDKFEKITLEDSQKALDESESLSAYHKEALPWVYDKETGDLYEYDDFEESFVPIKDYEYSFEYGLRIRKSNSSPAVIHGNGGAYKEIFPLIEATGWPQRK